MTLAIYSELTIFAFFSLLTVVFLALWFVIFFLTFFEASTSYEYFHYVSYGIFPQWFSLNQIFGFVCYCGRKNRPSHGQCFMHQSILTVPCAPPPAPPGYCGAFACLVSPGGGVFANFVLPGGRALANLGAIPEVGKHARGLLSKYNYTEDFSGKESRLTHLSRKKLKRVVKVCSCFYTCISSLNYIAKSGAIDVNQRFWVIESNFCWYHLKNILSYL